ISALPGGADGVVASLQEERARAQRLENRLAAVEAGVPQLRKELSDEQAKSADLGDSIATLRRDYNDLQEENDALHDDVETYRSKYEALANPGGADATASLPWWKWLFTSWQGITVCVLAAVGFGTVGVLAMQRAPLIEPRDEADDREKDADLRDSADEEGEASRQPEDVGPPQRT
ncbi:MAG: hypothetical protein KDA41_19160, partial [Planctomycetales bacterium]|nr:hypothetical protein [Planctomycetales bacterium]